MKFYDFYFNTPATISHIRLQAESMWDAIDIFKVAYPQYTDYKITTIVEVSQ